MDTTGIRKKDLECLFDSSENSTCTEMERCTNPKTEEWMEKTMVLAEMAKLTILINISSVVSTWKLCLDFVLETEKNELLMPVNIVCFYRNGYYLLSW